MIFVRKLDQSIHKNLMYDQSNESICTSTKYDTL